MWGGEGGKGDSSLMEQLEGLTIPPNYATIWVIMDSKGYIKNYSKIEDKKIPPPVQRG